MKQFLRALAALATAVCGLAHAAPQTTYYHNDLAGSPVAATDGEARVIWRESYRPYGERTVNWTAGHGNKVWFTSRRQDVETGLVYMGARYYDPLAARFVSQDPVQFVEGNIHSFNRYAYGNNNPHRYSDPTGMWGEDIALAAPGLAVGAISLGKNITMGNYLAAAVDVVGLIVDGVALATPGVPGGAGLAIGAVRKAGSEAAEAGARVKPDFIVSPNGTALPTNKDFNLVDSQKPGGDWLQIHSTHTDAKALGVSHTHYPVSHRQSRTRETKATSGSDLDKADSMLRSGQMRERLNRSDKGGALP